MAHSNDAAASPSQQGNILVAGLSPAWQQILCFDRLELGTVNRATAAHWCASGKVLNVARALSALGAPTTVISPAGGPSGDSIQNEFRGLPLSADWVATDVPTRVCTTILDSATGMTTELVENAAPVTEPMLADYFDRFRQLAATASLVIFTGSLPRGTPPEYVANLLRPSAVPLVLDIRGPELLACLDLQPLVVKPNRDELAHTLGKPLARASDVATGIRSLVDAGARHVIVSNGPQQLLFNMGQELWACQPPSVVAVNPIGCGDSLTAGIAWATGQGENFPDAIRFGVGAAVQNALDLLPCRIDSSTAAQYASQVVIERCQG